MSRCLLFSGYGAAGYALFVAVYAGLEVRNTKSYCANLLLLDTIHFLLLKFSSSAKPT